MCDHAEPFIVAEETEYLVVYKPRRYHSAPLEGRVDDSLLLWCAAQYPESVTLLGKKKGEGGLVHRLDFDTAGLVLIARNQAFLDWINSEQAAGRFLKEYRAVCGRSNALPPGFPPIIMIDSFPNVLESGFRAYGPGRRSVRPVQMIAEKGRWSSVQEMGRRKVALDRGEPYRTELLSVEQEEERLSFSVRLRRGFRHQIRCHLAWLGYPILGDTLYGLESETAAIKERYPDLLLCANVLEFRESSEGRLVRISLDSLNNDGGKIKGTRG